MEEPKIYPGTNRLRSKRKNDKRIGVLRQSPLGRTSSLAIQGRNTKKMVILGEGDR